MIFNRQHNVDYHIHTYYSDGRLSPEEVVTRFKNLGYESIAITDHDGVGGVAEALETGRKLGIEVIPGIEFSTRTAEENIGLHMLGYNIDTHSRPMLERIEDIRAWREERNDRIIRELADMGYPLTRADLEMRDGQDFIGKPIFARALVNRGYIADVKEAFTEKVFKSSRLRAIKKEVITSDEAISLIRGAGGIPVLAHPGVARGLGDKGSDEFFANMEMLVARLKKQGLEGIECYYPKHTDDEAQRFVSLAVKYNLKITKGSDFHDPDLLEEHE